MVSSNWLQKNPSSLIHVSRPPFSKIPPTRSLCESQVQDGGKLFWFCGIMDRSSSFLWSKKLLLLLSCSLLSDSLWPHRLQHIRLPCASPSGACSNSCPLSQWCHPTISSSVAPFSCLQSFPASGSFLMSQLFISGGPSTGVSASASVLPMNIQGWFPEVAGN